MISEASGFLGDVWVYDLERGSRIRLTDDGLNLFPRWSPDGRRVAFLAGERMPISSGIRLAAVDGSGETELALSVAGISAPLAWTLDGETLTLIQAQRPGEWDIRAMRLGEAPFDVLISDYSTGNHDLSPDGQWLFYTSNETGRLEMYVGPFSNPDAKVAGRWQQSGAVVTPGR